MPEFSCKKFRSDRKSTRLNSSHTLTSYAVFCLKKNTAPPPGAPRGRRQPPRGARRGPPRPPSPPGLVLASSAATRSVRAAARCPFFFFNDTATTEIYTLSLHDALPI